MAYQPKSYRKFVATAATATLVATAFAPFASAHSFKDVEEKYNEAVDFLVSKGVNGYADGTFKTQKTITRLEAAEMLGKALGLTEVTDAPASGFTDVPARVATLINAFKAEGITTGKTETTFGSNDEITRGELAIWIQRAYDLEAKEGSTNKFTDVADRYKEAVQALVDNGITQGATETTFGTTANAKRGDYALFIKRAVDASTPVEVAPAVESVSAINAKQLVVKFTTELEGESTTLTNDATDGANYKLGTASADKAVLSEDKKSVTLTFNGGVEVTDEVFVVNPVATTSKDEKGAVVNTVKYTEILTYKDTVAPTVVSTSYANGVITVQYSEEIGTVPSVVRVNGEPVAASTISINSSDATKVDINFAGLTAGSTNNLYIAGTKDTADVANEAALYNGTVIAPTADTSKPQVTGVTVTGQNTAKVSLNKDITGSEISAKLQKGTVIHNVTLKEDTTDSTGKTYTLTVDLNGDTAGDGIFTGTSTSETFSLLLAAEVLVDSVGNKSNEFITSLTFVKDTKAPALVKSEVSTDKTKVLFTFDEALTVKGLDANIVVKNSEGVKLGVIDSETALNSTDNKVYEVDFVTGATEIAAGTYTVTIPAEFFQDIYGNKTSAVTQTITVGAPTSTDTDKPVAQVSTSATNKFTVTFNEEVTSSALNLANYKLDGNALPAGTEIYFTNTDKTTVEIILPVGSVNIGDQSTGANAILTVSNVQDKAGNANVTSNHTVVVKDNTAATIQSVQVIGTDVYVTFNENVTVAATTDANDVFDLKVNSLVSEAGNIAAVTGNAKQVKFTLDANPAATLEVKVKADQTALKDANGVAVK